MLLDAKFITYGHLANGDAAGVHVARDCGSARQSGAQFLTGLFQCGETEVVMAPISVLMESQGGEIVGLLPAELQAPDLVFFAAMPSTCRQPFEAKTLIDFLTGRLPSRSIMKGMDPG